MNKSQSRPHKSPKKHYELSDENLGRPRTQSHKQKIGMGKRSHEGSYMIGAEAGVDWPLEPKWKGEGGGKIRNALRRR